MTGGGLSAEQVKALLAKPDKKPRKKKGVDTSVRDHQTWFQLAAKAVDENMDNLQCDNPNCIDPRPPRLTSTGVEVRAQAVAEIGDKRMCRYCFFDGWLLEDSAQLQL